VIEKSQQLRNEITELQASAEMLKSEANTLIERSKHIAQEINKRMSSESQPKRDAA